MGINAMEKLNKKLAKMKLTKAQLNAAGQLQDKLNIIAEFLGLK